MTVSRARQMAAIIEREGDGYVPFCPELDIASQGSSIEVARATVIEVRTRFFETAPRSEVARLVLSEVFVTHVEIPIG